MQKIASLQRRLVWRRRAAAVCAVAAAAIAAAFALGAADYIVRFDDRGLRIMATLTLVALIAWAIYRWAYLPTRRRLGPLAVARRIERRFPQLRDSLASAVEFLAQPEEDRTAGSPQLRRVVVSEVQTVVDDLPLDEVIDPRPLRRAASWLAAAVLLLAIGVAWDAGVVSTALARLAAPLGAAQWPRKHYLAFRDAPTRLAAGQTFEVTLIDTAGPLPNDVRIEYRIAGSGGTEHVSERTMRSGDAMIARRENVRESFAFRAVGGDDRAMRWHHVEVVEPPRLESLSIFVHPPVYTGWPAEMAGPHLDVLAGAAIEVRGAANQPLGSARILLDGAHSIAAIISTDETPKDRKSFHIPAGNWTATKSGQYSLELTGSDGLGGVVGRWSLRVQPDSPPSLSWRRPMEDLYVTSNAIVPIEVLVKDNLAIEKVELVIDRLGIVESDPAQHTPEQPIELYRGPERVAARFQRRLVNEGETRTIEHAINLAPLEISVGAQLSLHAEATDYRPGVGRTAVPRRLTVISSDELHARLAELQSQIVRQLERALSLQQATREDVRRLQNEWSQAAALDRGSRNTLQAAELNQRRVKQMLSDPGDGVPALVASLTEQVQMNRPTGTDLLSPMEGLLREIERLSAGPLGVAERELLATNKSADSLAPASARAGEELMQSLAAAGDAQDDVITALERLLGELSRGKDYQFLARDLVELRKNQLAHAQATRAEIGVQTLPLQLSELSSAQREQLARAAAAQTAIARRYERIERDMGALVRELPAGNENASTVAAAIELARSLAIAADMQASARDLNENRIGQSLAAEAQIADKLQRLIDLLRNEGELVGETFAEKLHGAENRLASLRKETAALRQQLADAEQSGSAPTTGQLEKLNAEQSSLQREIEQLAAQLDRLQARDAGDSARNAAQRLDNAAASETRSPAQPPRPSSSAAARAAERDLEQAAQKLARRRQQANDDLALEFIRRFQRELGEMVKRQRRIVDDTVEIDASRRPDVSLENDDLQRTAKLANEERGLATLASEHSEMLHGLGAVRVGLDDAGRRLLEAANILGANETGARAQRAERLALARLQRMLEAFEQTASEAASNRGEQPDAQAAQPGEQPRRRPTFELLEVKMLRMLQADLNDRTQQFEANVERFAESASENEQVELKREAQQLQAEQSQLSELVEEMLNRDNVDKSL